MKECVQARGLNGLDRKTNQVRGMRSESLFGEHKEDMVRNQDARICCYAASEGSPQTNSVGEIPGLFHRLLPTVVCRPEHQSSVCLATNLGGEILLPTWGLT